MTPLAGYAATVVIAALLTFGLLMLGDERTTPLVLVALFAGAVGILGCLAVLPCAVGLGCLAALT